MGRTSKASESSSSESATLFTEITHTYEGLDDYGELIVVPPSDMVRKHKVRPTVKYTWLNVQRGNILPKWLNILLCWFIVKNGVTYASKTEGDISKAHFKSLQVNELKWPNTDNLTPEQDAHPGLHQFFLLMGTKVETKVKNIVGDMRRLNLIQKDIFGDKILFHPQLIPAWVDDLEWNGVIARLGPWPEVSINFKDFKSFLSKIEKSSLQH